MLLPRSLNNPEVARKHPAHLQQLVLLSHHSFSDAVCWFRYVLRTNDDRSFLHNERIYLPSRALCFIFVLCGRNFKMPPFQMKITVPLGVAPHILGEVQRSLLPPSSGC